jgi:starch-binding outer membrane protein, SusD/RagB family
MYLLAVLLPHAAWHSPLKQLFKVPDMKMHTFYIFLIILNTACSKSYLEKSPSNQFGATDDLIRLASLLNNDLLMGETPVIGEESADDHYLLPDYYNSLPQQDKNIYTWEKEIFGGKTNIPDWSTPYSQVFTCNLVLEGLSKIKKQTFNQQQWNETKGYALFMRSYALFNVAQIFAAIYDKDKEDTDPGIPLPFTTDIYNVPPRSSMKQSFDQITGDLKIALPLVPKDHPGAARNLPSKPAVYALLARIYLYMQDYNQARTMADSTLLLKNQLLNFNTLNPRDRYPIPDSSEEILYQSWLNSTSNIIMGRAIPGCIIDSTLYSTYDNNDLRKEMYFMTSAGQPIFKNNGTGKAFAFSGLSTCEAYLIRAECNARMGNTSPAMSDLNMLLENRYKTGTLIKRSASSPADALSIVLRERRKELVFRGQRWPDLKRLNKEEAGIVLTRVINGQTFRLLPKSNHYILPIPDDALSGGKIVQNIRD